MTFRPRFFGARPIIALSTKDHSGWILTSHLTRRCYDGVHECEEVIGSDIAGAKARFRHYISSDAPHLSPSPGDALESCAGSARVSDTLRPVKPRAFRAVRVPAATHAPSASSVENPWVLPTVTHPADAAIFHCAVGKFAIELRANRKSIEPPNFRASRRKQ